MGQKIITDQDFWMCTMGAIPAQLQGSREGTKNAAGHIFITKKDKCTTHWFDFGCTQYMYIIALAAVGLALLAVAIAAATVATGGLALVAIGAVAGAVGGTIAAVRGALVCGQGVHDKRTWSDSKGDMVSQEVDCITGDHTMTCSAAGGLISYAPNIKTWLGAFAMAAINYTKEILTCAFIGAGAATVGGLFGIGSMAGTTAGISISLPTLGSVASNILASFGIGQGMTGAAIAIGSRLIFGGNTAANNYAKGNENVGNSFLEGAVPEYEFFKRIKEKGFSGLQATDALILLEFVNIKFDPPKIKNSTNLDVNNPKKSTKFEPKAPKLKPKPDPKTGKKKGKAYEDGDKPDLELVVELEAKRLIATQSGSKNGPCLAGVYDPVTKKIFFGQNFQISKKHGRDAYDEFVKNAHDIIKNRIKQRKLDIKNGVATPGPKDGKPGAHAEIVALDKAIKARELKTGKKVTEADLDSFDLHNRTLNKSSEPRPMVRCSNCGFITDGVNTCGHN